MVGGALDESRICEPKQRNGPRALFSQITNPGSWREGVSRKRFPCRLAPGPGPFPPRGGGGGQARRAGGREAAVISTDTRSLGASITPLLSAATSISQGTSL